MATGRKATFVNADGKQTVEPVYMLRSLTVGERTVTNVECNVTDEGDPLLGQSFLGRLDRGRSTMPSRRWCLGPWSRHERHNYEFPGLAPVRRVLVAAGPRLSCSRVPGRK